jgi:hypothetical protein
MERKGPPISLDEFRRRFGNRTNLEGRLTPIQQISAVQRDAHQLMTATLDRLNQTSEDAYATRNEATKFISFLGGFSRKIATARPGSMVDLTKTVVDDGYDAEEDAAARDEGIDYRTEADRAEAEYATHLYSVRTLLPRLRKAGVQVKVGFKRVFPQK